MAWTAVFRQWLSRRWLLLVGLALVLTLVLLLVGRKGRPAKEQVAEPELIERVPPAKDTQLIAGKELYSNYCLACHGEKGRGDGRASRFLYPKPRDFGEGKFRIVTTTNRIPSDQDLLHVVNRGMPGSAMFPFAHLGEGERMALVTYVRSLMRAAFEERAREQAKAQGEEVDEADLAKSLDRVTRGQDALAIPADLPPLGAAAVARGREVYRRVGCVLCHGDTGKGDGAQKQLNDDGTPTRPRDFGHGYFKGGAEFPQLYARIMLGMPGSPMPSSRTSIKPSEASDLIHFVLSLSGPAAAAQVEHKRTGIMARKTNASLANEITADAWRSAAALPIVVSPVWWRDNAEVDLRVQALHDGQLLAIRLTWRDTTHDSQAVRPQDFEDMAAIQLFRGSPEPFLGMGASEKPVDVWLWRAGGHKKASDYADVDTAYPNMAVDLYPLEGPAEGARPHATDRQPREFITALAAGNLRSDPNNSVAGSSLQAKGFGTLSMRPRISQHVTASGEWKEGQWTVLLRRHLEVSPEAGMPLTSGDRLSIAFAIWDGAARDRNGQKQVSIWHDLNLE